MMKKIFISVPAKLLALIISTLLIISIGFSTVSLLRLQKEFKNFQREALKKGKEHWDVHNSLLSGQLLIWLESFSDMILKDDLNDFSNVSKALAKQYDTLQLHLNVENLWFVDQQQKILFSSTQLPKIIQNKISTVIRVQTPINEVFCRVSCQQLIVMPLLNYKGELAVVALTASLVDMLYSMKRTLKSDVAIVSFAKEPKGDNSSAKIISASDLALVKSILKDKIKGVNIALAQSQGVQYDLDHKNYLLNLLFLSENNNRRYYLALVDDVTRFKTEGDNYRRQFLFSIVVVFIGLAFIIYLVTSPFAKRLLALSNALPLLAKKQFTQFRQVNLKRIRIFPDELDVLADSALELSYELEQLNLEVEQKTKELENIAMYDLLTGLPNRNMLNYQLNKVLPNLARNNSSVAILFLDLDDFKKINDSHGHAEGDRLLVEAASRIRLSLRKVDIVCRFGGDEFVVLLDQLNTIIQAKLVAEKILEQFKAPIKIGSNLFYISTSIGLSYTTDPNFKTEDLIRQADIAMYEAKSEGGGKYFIYQDEMYLRVAQQVMLETEVRQALEKDQFSLSLQPQISAKDNKFFGFEALLRWKHPERGMVSPEDFIPILDNSEYMIELGYWVIRRCFELVAKMRKKGLEDVNVAINLTAGQFVDQHLIAYLKALIAEFKLPASCFELELTEQTLVKDIDLAIDVMQQLKEIGFSFAIDDFGTGYSSLAYLKKMPVDVIKIDKSFVFGMLENQADYLIIKSTIAMVKSLGLIVVAEGVETSAQLRHLAQLDCDLIQGYFYAKPIPETELFEFIDAKIRNGYWITKVEKVS